MKNRDEERKLIWNHQQQHGLYFLAKRFWMKQKAQERAMEDMKQELQQIKTESEQTRERMRAMEQKLQLHHEDAKSVTLQFDELALIFTDLNTTQNR